MEVDILAKKQAKTNAVRLIEQQKIPHELFEYTTEDGGAVDGITVAGKIGQLVEYVFKTLIATAGKGEKKVELIPVKELLGLTGYVRGGCSPIGMKKLFPTYIDQSAQTLDFIIVSAGKIGMQIKLAPIDLANASSAQFAAITM